MNRAIVAGVASLVVSLAAAAPAFAQQAPQLDAPLATQAAPSLSISSNGPNFQV